MKHTIAQNKQLFNVKAIADSVTLENLADGQFGVYPVGVDTSIPAATAFAALPEEFRIISKLGGKVYTSFDTIKKEEMRHFQSKAYTAPAVNIWETIVEHCDCINTALVRIGIEEDALMRRDGLSWTDTDNALVSAPKELACACDCTGKAVYDNHMMTEAIINKINDSDSPYYLAYAKIDVSGLTTYANQAALDVAVPAPTLGAMAILTDITSTVMYNGTAWIVIGDVAGKLSDLAAFIAANKVINTDDDELNDSAKVTLVIEGKPAAAAVYRDLDVNYIFPRGAKLFPAITVNDGVSCIEFTETQALGYELGAGADLRAEEFECMSLYTDLNHYPQLHDGIASANLIYQFVNGAQYNTVDFEFYTEKVNRNDGDKRSFGVMLGTDDAGVFAALNNMFIA